MLTQQAAASRDAPSPVRMLSSVPATPQDRGPCHPCGKPGMDFLAQPLPFAAAWEVNQQIQNNPVILLSNKLVFEDARMTVMKDGH